MRSEWGRSGWRDQMRDPSGRISVRSARREIWDLAQNCEAVLSSGPRVAIGASTESPLQERLQGGIWRCRPCPQKPVKKPSSSRGRRPFLSRCGRILLVHVSGEPLLPYESVGRQQKDVQGGPGAGPGSCKRGAGIPGHPCSGAGKGSPVVRFSD